VDEQQMLEALESALDSLEATGALQSQQRVGIRTLLNPPEESGTMEETLDEDICQGVLAACNVEDGGSISDEDGNTEEDTPVEPCPSLTYCKVFQVLFKAISTLNRYTVFTVDNRYRDCDHRRNTLDFLFQIEVFFIYF
jgi:hypothetical protein